MKLGPRFILSKARYGLRGVRVGEAQNPGPGRLRRISTQDSDLGRAAAGASAIHHDLTLIDSSDDDAPLVRTGFSAVEERGAEIELACVEGVQFEPRSASNVPNPANRKLRVSN